MQTFLPGKTIRKPARTSTNQSTPPSSARPNTNLPGTIEPHRPLHIPTQILIRLGRASRDPQTHILNRDILARGHRTTLETDNICRRQRARHITEIQIADLELGVCAVPRSAREGGALRYGERGALEVVERQARRRDVGDI